MTPKHITTSRPTAPKIGTLSPMSNDGNLPSIGMRSLAAKPTRFRPCDGAQASLLAPRVLCLSQPPSPFLHNTTPVINNLLKMPGHPEAKKEVLGPLFYSVSGFSTRAWPRVAKKTTDE
ncbi:hypothetical protein CSPAE12_08867 [Colletotrichum incanum]|nr:hypothetical protein CSPAE12_08867 [Colletotrichum incanum]